MLTDNYNPSSSNGNGNLGIPDDLTFSDGFFNFWNPNYKCSNAFDDINELLLKLLPSKPLDLSMVPLIINNAYSAREESTGNIHNPCIDNLSPLGHADHFYNGDDGILTCEIDGIQHGIITITANDDTGNFNDSLRISDDSDPYAGQAGKEGFWHQLSAEIIPSFNLTYDHHTYSLTHSQSGTTQTDLWVDNPQLATISNSNATLPSNCTRWISGVPSLAINDNINYTGDLNNAVGKHYHLNYVAELSSSATNSNTFDPSTPPAENAVINLSFSVFVQNNRYTENLTLSITPYNSKEACPSASYATNARVDTVSNENRVRSGSGNFPVNGNGNGDYGDSYDSTISLKTTPYDTELQLLNGQYQRPTGNYSSNLPTSGPDYSTGIGTSIRWVTFQTITISNKSGLNISFTNTDGTWNGIETSGIEIYVKVEGETGWLNGNKSYPGVGSPSNDDDYAMVYSMSSSTSKRITFGPTVRSGIVYVRIGLPDGSNKKFSGVNVNAI